MAPTSEPSTERGPPPLASVTVVLVTIGILFALLVGTSRCDTLPGNRPWKGRGTSAPA